MAGWSTKKKIGAASGVALVAVIFAVILLLGKGGEQESASQATQDYIFDKTYDITLDEIVKSTGVASPEEDGQALASSAPSSYTQAAIDNYFDEMGVSILTRKYFKYLEKKFKTSKDLESHLAEVKDFLLSQLPEEEAMAYFALYKKYLSCEMELAREQKDWAKPTDAEGVIALLARIQEFRRAFLGQDIADTLFGGEIKTKEYSVRRSAIVADKNLYGAEKEALIDELNEEMWGDQSEAVETHGLAYNRYQEKLRMYELDFEEMESEEEKTELTHDFRTQFFNDEQVAALQEVDTMLAQQQETEASFRQGEQEILENPDLTQEEKDQAIQELAEEVFQDEAQAHFRREAIEKGKKAMMESMGQ